MSVWSDFRLFGYLHNGKTYFSPRFKSVGFVSADADVNDDEDVTVRTNAKSRAELNQLLGVSCELTTTTNTPNTLKLLTSGEGI